MSTKKALLVVGGWDGHEPELVAARFQAFLESENFEVEVSRTLDVFSDKDKLFSLDLFIPVWTMAELPIKEVKNLIEAVGSGVGMAGCHGGMCDAFRNNVAWQFLTGGNWVAHPGCDNIPYRVNIKQSSSPLTADIKDFDISSEQYYLHVDPANEILATTSFPVEPWYHNANGKVEMPVVWTRKWGNGRIYYNALGHHNDVFDIPEAWELMKRGLLWAAEGKTIVQQQGLSDEQFKNDKGMY